MFISTFYDATRTLRNKKVKHPPTRSQSLVKATHNILSKTL